MNAETFCEHFATFADAPNGIVCLRQMILQLAIGGRLVRQDANDEPSNELLARIRRRPIESSERDPASRKSVRSSVSSNGDSGELPHGWTQTRLGDIAEIIMGNSPPGSSYNEHGQGVPLINGPVEFSEGPFGLTVRTKFTTEPTKFCKKDDLLICVRGSTTGRTNIAAFDACIGRGVAAVQAGEVQQYVNLFVLALRQAIFDMGTGSTFPSISYHQISDIPFPLPPLAEQRRIVEKVDQLLGLCDELAARQAAQREKRQRLVGATVDRLVSSRNPAEFPTHAHRLRNHFDQLFDTTTTIPQLRQTILQLAVQGQLVPQDADDEPADSLLANIHQRRRELVAEGTLAATPKPVPLADGEVETTIPEHWRWARLNDLVSVMDSGWSPACDEQPTTDESEWGVLKTTAVQTLYFNQAAHKRLPSGLQPRPDAEAKAGDLLITRRSAESRWDFLPRQVRTTATDDLGQDHSLPSDRTVLVRRIHRIVSQRWGVSGAHRASKIWDGSKSDEYLAG